MKRILAVLLILLTILAAGCGSKPEDRPKATEAPGLLDLYNAAKASQPQTHIETEPVSHCFDCDSTENIYDGYCYYCHPDFLFLCVRCGCLWPAHRTPDMLCDYCVEEVKNGAPMNLNKPKVVTEHCVECGDAPGEYDGYCYYCHPDFLFLCEKCGCLWPSHRKPSGLCDYCEGAA